MSSVVLASQRMPAGKKADSPLVRDGMQLVPNLPHVFRQDQHLYLLYEVYDPSHSAPENGKDNGGKASGKSPAAPVKLLTSIEFLNGSTKAFETPLVEATALNTPTRGAVAFQFDVPLADLKPGLYVCQINVIDDAGGTFSFPRTAVLIRDAVQQVATPAQPAPPASRLWLSGLGVSNESIGKSPGLKAPLIWPLIPGLKTGLLPKTLYSRFVRYCLRVLPPHKNYAGNQ